jgi:hypothetical protein
MKNSAFCNLKRCGQLKASRPFEATCCLHLQGQGISQARSGHESGKKQSATHAEDARLFTLGQILHVLSESR